MEQQRKKFEEWARSDQLSLMRYSDSMDNDYISLSTSDAWKGWQASAAQSQQEIAMLREALTKARIALETAPDSMTTRLAKQRIARALQSTNPEGQQ